LDEAAGEGEDYLRPQVRTGWEGAAQVAVTGHGGRMFLEDPGLRFALNARPTASQGFAPAGAFQKHERVIFRKDRASEFISKRIKKTSARAGGNKTRWGQIRASKGAKSS
jgi:hypothetical protein